MRLEEEIIDWRRIAVRAGMLLALLAGISLLAGGADFTLGCLDCVVRAFFLIPRA